MPNTLLFVVLGLGEKPGTSCSTDRARRLDLDAAYAAIIKPAVLAAGLECSRADEISHSGSIDKKMYEMLLRADLVVADISTANPNALYELGVRHALRPRRTIVIKEADGRFIFDLNHLATLQYKHLGEDIGVKEAQVKVPALRALIDSVMTKSKTDSPVYTYLQGLSAPMMSPSELGLAIEDARASRATLSRRSTGRGRRRRTTLPRSRVTTAK